LDELALNLPSSTLTGLEDTLTGYDATLKYPSSRSSMGRIILQNKLLVDG
jgi:hypothetical protein